MTAVSCDQTFVYEDLPGEEWDLPGYIVAIHPGPSGPPQKYMDHEMDGLRVPRMKE